jgi:GH24 family phage-related lysozyme (muramidase)
MKTFQQFLIEGSQQTDCDINGYCKEIKQNESAGNEEKVLSLYKDSKGFSTIGHGHLVGPKSKQIFNSVFADEQKRNPNWVEEVLTGKRKLTPQNADSLLYRDVSDRIPQVKKSVSNFDSYSPELRTQLTSEHYRGMLGKSPNAIKKLNQGDYEGAATEYLNAEDYRNSVRDKTGIAPRMKRLADAIRMEPERQKKRKQSSQQTIQAPQLPSTSQKPLSR